MSYHESLRLLVIVTLLVTVTHASAQVVEIPDPNLKAAIREELQLPVVLNPNNPITKQQMLRLTGLYAVDQGIQDLSGLESATNLDFLDLGGNQIWDIQPLASLVNLTALSLYNTQVKDIAPLANLINLTHLNLAANAIENLEPLAGLIQLQTLDLFGNRIKDLTPLANLTELRTLILTHNQVGDLTPLANHPNLENLYITGNLVADFTPLLGLNLIEFHYDEVCDIPPLLPPVRERIENRTFPSVFQAWDHVVGLDSLTEDQRVALHDLHFSPYFGLSWAITTREPAEGLATSLAGSLSNARQTHQRRIDLNPNMIFLLTIDLHSHFTDDAFPPNSDFWLKDENGEIARRVSGSPLINFLKPEVQDLIVKRIVAAEKCGFYDGVMFDGFNHNGTGFVGREHYPVSDEEIISANLNIFRSVRSSVRDDFLILINTNRSKATRYTAYINGTFMETGSDNEYLFESPGGYVHEGLAEIESTLLWSEQNLRPPQINCLEGWGIPTEPPDSPENRRWMRVFTTMSLTHSDGYVMYNTGMGAVRVCDDCPYPWGPGHEHWWYSFWDADLGRPIGQKAQQYQNIPGIFIREFTNGWAVYNRSGNAQTISLPQLTAGISSSKRSTTHLLPDLDGEIYLKGKSFADVNGDGNINILDLVQVANGLGESAPDPNGDGVVNILDLVFVAQQFSR